MTDAADARPQYVRARTAARLLDVAPSTLRRWVMLGRIPAHRLSPRCTLFDVAAVRAAVARFGVVQ